ncbi:MAG: hypothetical protein HY232_12215 [Acidobacteria bacterium]|nr:hypothetical protein [Acidobacteriota bacterium]
MNVILRRHWPCGFWIVAGGARLSFVMRLRRQRVWTGELARKSLPTAN